MNSPPGRSRERELFIAMGAAAFLLCLVYGFVWEIPISGELDLIGELRMRAQVAAVVVLAIFAPSIVDYATSFSRRISGRVTRELQGPPRLAIPAEAAPALRRVEARNPGAKLVWGIWDAMDGFYARCGVPWLPAAFVFGGLLEGGLCALAFLWPYGLIPGFREALVRMATIYGGLVVAAPLIVGIAGAAMGIPFRDEGER